MDLMGRKKTRTAVLISVALVISACAFGQPRGGLRPSDMERMLSLSGFVKNVADSPEKMAEVEALPQGRVFPQPEGDEVYYVYADSEDCRCLYVGDSLAFARFEELIREENYSRSQCIDERLRQRSEQSWQAWGSLGDLCSDRPR
ncbi:MAG: hypothetical protein JSV26_01270 [bacterium]|nr:MAG: hypothetical protein JSV26_01270 [bacterium]